MIKTSFYLYPEEFVFPKSRLESARVLKYDDNCILTILNFLGQYIDLYLDTRKSWKLCSSEYEVKSKSQRNRWIA